MNERPVIDRLIAERIAEAEASRLTHDPTRGGRVRRRVGGWLIDLGETIAATPSRREAH
jgi:hypothetical protein